MAAPTTASVSEIPAPTAAAPSSGRLEARRNARAQRRRPPDREHDQQRPLGGKGPDREQPLAVAKVGRALELGLREVGVLGDRSGVEDLAPRAQQPDRRLGDDHRGDRDRPDPHRRRAPREEAGAVRTCRDAHRPYDRRLSSPGEAPGRPPEDPSEPADARSGDHRHPLEPARPRGGAGGDRRRRGRRDLVPRRRRRLRRRARRLHGDRQGALRCLPGRQPRPRGARRARRLRLLVGGRRGRHLDAGERTGVDDGVPARS